jgi:predicted methyltransferase
MYPLILGTRGAHSYVDGRVRQVLRVVRTHPEHGSRTDLDQCPATIETVLRRVSLLARRPVDILLIGDDDLLGLALALGAARRRIAILDADRVLLARIRQFVPPGVVELAEHDVRHGLPHGLRGRFDEVFTDPPYTLAGQLLFIHRAVWALRPTPGASLYVCASRAYMAASQLAAVQSFLRLAGFELVATYPDFNRYKAPPDVRRDLKERGWRRTAWLDSDLFHYVRGHAASVPPLPSECKARIYEYTTTTTGS